jgi:glycosyltransferase involved in cell wall biosynthesis
MADVRSPKVSIIVIFYEMARQAENTLYSLSTAFQRNVSEADYEIVAVENSSDDELGEERATAVAPNIRYYHRVETGVSPVPALNFAFEQCRGELVGIIVDGARMVSPRVVEHVLLARNLFEHPLIVVPGYHLGDQEHHFHESAGYSEEVEERLLNEIDWKRNGYDLFNISVFSGANPKGFFGRFLESNCLFCTRESFEAIGRADPRFTLPGGGSVNIYIYHALARLPHSRLVVLAGEGSFHQFHGGVTTAEVPDREERIRTHQANLAEVFGGPFQGMHREPLILGHLPGQVQRFVQLSAEDGIRHHRFCRRRSLPEWDVDGEQR